MISPFDSSWRGSEDVDPLRYCSGDPSVVITSCMLGELAAGTSKSTARCVANVPNTWHESPGTRGETRIRSGVAAGCGKRAALTEN